MLPHCSVEAICGKHKVPAYIQLLTELVEAKVDVSSEVEEATPQSEAGVVGSSIAKEPGDSPVVGEPANMPAEEVPPGIEDPTATVPLMGGGGLVFL